MRDDQSLFDEDAISVAEAEMSRALDDLSSGAGAQRAIAVKAPAGAGKSSFISRAVGRARGTGQRVAVVAPTNEQAFGLAHAIAIQHPNLTVSFMPASNRVLPAATADLPNVIPHIDAQQANNCELVVATLDKLGDWRARRILKAFDALLIDEAFQANSPQYFAVSDLAPLHLTVGDGGQLNPFSTIKTADQWRGLPEDPLQTAIGVLLRHHPQTPLYHMPISRRLDGRAVVVAQAFYPDLAFRAAVLPDTRELNLAKMLTRDSRARMLDKVLDVAARAGWAHLELPEAPVLSVDPGIVEAILGLVDRLFARSPQVRCERERRWAGLAPRRVAIGVSHNDQKDVLRARLDAAGFPEVVVNTANKVQGLEYDLMIAWHPLAGLPEADPFHLDPGRLCVLSTRHRHACVVVGRAGDRALLEGVPPATPAYLGWSPDPILDGWGVHQAFFRALEPWRVTA